MDFEELKARYIAGETAQELSKVCELSAWSINDRLKKAGVPRQSKSYTIRRGQGYTLNEHAFDVLTPEAAYWVGLLMADGNINKNQIQLRFKREDREHLEKFRSFLGSNANVFDGVNPAHKIKGVQVGDKEFSGFVVSSIVLVKRLVELGIVPRKSLIATVPPELKNSREYWLGLLDGDGHLSAFHMKERKRADGHSYYKARTNVVLTLCGSETVVSGFRDYVVGFDPTITNKVSKQGNIFTFRIQGSKSKSIIDHFYTGSTLALPRKAAAAIEILNTNIGVVTQ